jgi:hypothetical protein
MLLYQDYNLLSKINLVGNYFYHYLWGVWVGKVNKAFILLNTPMRKIGDNIAISLLIIEIVI